MMNLPSLGTLRQLHKQPHSQRFLIMGMAPSRMGGREGGLIHERELLVE